MDINTTVEEALHLSATEFTLLLLAVIFVMLSVQITNRIALFLAALLIAYVYINKIVKVSKRTR